MANKPKSNGKVKIDLENLEKLVDAVDIQFIDDVPGLGTIGIRSFNAEQREAYENALTDLPTKSGLARATLVKLVACDDSGELIFKDWPVEKLAKIPFNTINPMFSKALEVNGLKIQAVEEAQKN